MTGTGHRGSAGITQITGSWVKTLGTDGVLEPQRRVPLVGFSFNPVSLPSLLPTWDRGMYFVLQEKKLRLRREGPMVDGNHGILLQCPPSF